MRSFSLASISRATRNTTRLNPFTPQSRNFSFTQAIMGVNKTIITEGSGAIPSNGQTVTIEYTGYLKDTNKPDNKGDKFDSSVGRGDFVVKIGVGQVIKGTPAFRSSETLRENHVDANKAIAGWDEGVTTMKVGEKATLDISPDYGYGARGFPGHIPANSSLIFDVELKNVK
ncbi:hypothetical protein FZEAL_3825 [Fusarium zealandicum]|uniref:peptidylprolyl isomerase n=1 Tax=Fusarium zealandicum TaxID=1053134 RepID=A0A8H4XMI7_9HYPO|nr:hypothetical protein FZEAL_3825 [Fusarium zealandicum]